MNIYDLSKEANVSIATISRVLNGSPNVKPATRKKVLDAIEQYHYTPNAFARGLGHGTMHSIGIMCADNSDLYLAKAVYYIERNLRQNGYHAILTYSGYEHEGVEHSLAHLMDQRVEAVFLVGSNYITLQDEENEYVRDFSKVTPLFLLNAAMDCPNVYCAVCDDFQAMQKATSRLLENGIEDILYFYNANSYSGMQKQYGYCSAYDLHGLTYRKELMRYFDGSRDDIGGMCRFLSDLREQGLVFHAVLASEDALAIGAVKYAKANHIRIPEELSIIGYNNSLLTLCSTPEVTSVDNRLETLCTLLAKTCLSVLAGENMPPKMVYSGELICRETTDFHQ